MTVQDQLQKLEADWTQAILRNDAAAIGEFVSDDWIIIGPDGAIIERARFLAVIASGELAHDSMESEDVRVRVYGDAAVLSAKTKSTGRFQGHPFSTHERSTSVYAKIDGNWQCVLTQLAPIAE